MPELLQFRVMCKTLETDSAFSVHDISVFLYNDGAIIIIIQGRLLLDMALRS